MENVEGVEESRKYLYKKQYGLLINLVWNLEIFFDKMNMMMQVVRVGLQLKK